MRINDLPGSPASVRPDGALQVLVLVGRGFGREHRAAGARGALAGQRETGATWRPASPSQSAPLAVAAIRPRTGCSRNLDAT